MPQPLTAESLSYWYFRLNGFMTIESFILHDRKGQRTDADIYGVRFPNRSELSMTDDVYFRHQTKPHLVICEIKRGPCLLNGPWTKKERENIQYVLSAIGAFPRESIDPVAAALYDECVFEDANYLIQLLAIGSKRNEEYVEKRPGLVQLTFPEMLKFVYQRFTAFHNEKRNHEQWDATGQMLWEASERRREDDFVDHILAATAIVIK
jgi:hypothetical protein